MVVREERRKGGASQQGRNSSSSGQFSKVTQRLETRHVLTAERVTESQWGQVGAGPRTQRALLAAVQALLQTPLCLSKLVLVQGLWPQLRLPGLKSESSFTLPAGTENGRGGHWVRHVSE